MIRLGVPVTSMQGHLRYPCNRWRCRESYVVWPATPPNWFIEAVLCNWHANVNIQIGEEIWEMNSIAWLSFSINEICKCVNITNWSILAYKSWKCTAHREDGGKRLLNSVKHVSLHKFRIRGYGVSNFRRILTSSQSANITPQKSFSRHSSFKLQLSEYLFRFLYIYIYIFTVLNTLIIFMTLHLIPVDLKY